MLYDYVNFYVNIELRFDYLAGRYERQMEAKRNRTKRSFSDESDDATKRSKRNFVILFSQKGSLTTHARSFIYKRAHAHMGFALSCDKCRRSLACTYMC